MSASRTPFAGPQTTAGRATMLSEYLKLAFCFLTFFFSFFGGRGYRKRDKIQTIRQNWPQIDFELVLLGFYSLQIKSGLILSDAFSAAKIFAKFWLIENWM